MVTTRVWLSRSCIAFCLIALCASVLLLSFPSEEPVIAAPPVVHQREHPFDPDWVLVHQILSTKCTSCHRAGTERQDFTTYESLMSAGVDSGYPAVVPGKADVSAIWESCSWNVEARAECELPDQPEMPPERFDWLTAGQLVTLKRWINNGALQYKLPAQCNTRPLMEMDFPSAKQCAGCHPKQYDEWSRSMHAYAQHSPITEAFNLVLQERTGGTMGTFCTRCHTPIGTALGENGVLRNVHRSRISMEGVTCVACHRRKDGRYKANGRVRVEPGKLLDTCIYGPFDDSRNVEGSHASAHKPYIKSSQFCGECHDVTNPVGVRLEEAFSEWQNSPAAKKGITCQHCHMGPVQGVPTRDCDRPVGRAAVVPGIDPRLIPLRPLADHTFAGPDYSLLPDTEFPHKLDWMYEKEYDQAKLTPYEQWSLNELRRRNRKSLAKADEKRYELLSNSARIKVTHPRIARASQRIHVDVDVASIFEGHSLPTGFTAERQVWISIEVRDPSGRLVFASGDVDKNQDLRDDHSHDVITRKIPRDPYLVNFQSKFITLTNKGTERSVTIAVNRHLAPLNVLRPATGVSASFGRPPIFRVSKSSLPPLRARTQRYPVRLSKCNGRHTVNVCLNYRHLPPSLLDHIGTPHLKHLLEIVVLDQYQGIISVEP